MVYLSDADEWSHDSHGYDKPTFYEQVRMVKFFLRVSGTILLEVPEWPKGLEKSGWCLER